MKKCRLCGEEKILSDFHKAPQCLDGHRGECKKCSSSQQRLRDQTPERMAARAADYEKNKDKWNERRRSPEGRRKYRARVAGSPSYVLSFALYRALKRRPTENPVTHTQLMEMFLQQEGKCAVSGLTMTWMRGKIHLTSISIDRIDSKRGYSADNVRLICHAINRLRGDHTDAEMLEVARAIVAKADEQEPSWKGFGYSAPVHTFTVN